MDFKAKLLSTLALGPVLMLMHTAAVAAAAAGGGEISSINMSPGVTEVGREIFDLHMLIFWICTIIGVVVFGVMFYSILYHRKSLGVKPSQFHESTKVEIAWTVFSFLILVGMAVPATATLLDIYDTEDTEMDVLIS